MFSVSLSPSSNRRTSQAKRMDGPVSTVNEVVKWGALRCRRSLRSPVGHLWSGHTTLMPLKEEHSNGEWSKTVQSVSIYASVCQNLLTGPRFVCASLLLNTIHLNGVKNARTQIAHMQICHEINTAFHGEKKKKEEGQTNRGEKFSVVPPSGD